MKAPDFIKIGSYWYNNDTPLSKLKPGDTIEVSFGEHRERTTTYVVIGSQGEDGKLTSIRLLKNSIKKKRDIEKGTLEGSS